MGVNHVGLHLFVTLLFLNRSNAVAPFQKLGGKRMPEGMPRSAFGQTLILHRTVNHLLDVRFVSVLLLHHSAFGFKDRTISCDRLNPKQFIEILSENVNPRHKC